METITEIHNWSECRECGTVGCPAPSDTSIMQPLYYCRRGEGGWAKGPGRLLLHHVFWMWQGSCTHEISAIQQPEEGLHTDSTGWHVTQMGKISHVFHRLRATGNQWMLRDGESVFSRDKIQCQGVNPKYMFMWATLKGLSELHVCVCINMQQ